MVPESPINKPDQTPGENQGSETMPTLTPDEALALEAVKEAWSTAYYSEPVSDQVPDSGGNK